MKTYGYGYGTSFYKGVQQAGVAPSNVVAPSLSRVVNSLVCNKGTWTGTEPISYSYVFIRSFDGGINFEVVQSSSLDTYNIAPSDNNALYRCNVIAQNGILPNGFVSSNDLSLGTIVPVIVSNPSISGQPFVSRTLTGTNGTWSNSPTSYAYQWQRSTDGGSSWSDIASAVSNTHVVQPEGSGSLTRLRVIASNLFGASSASFSNNISITLTLWDSYSTNAVLLYHNKLNRGAYYGNNIWEVRRTVDSALLNIGHDANGVVDIAAAISHAGAVNRIIRSQEFSTSWAVSGTLVSNNNLAPNGTNTATLWELGGQYHAVTQGEQTGLIPSTSIVDPTGAYTFSMHVKKVNNSQIRIGNSTLMQLYIFDFDNPASSTSGGSPIAAGYETLANGWFRIYITITGTQASAGIRIQGHHSSTAGTQYLIWGAHWNKGNAVTPYVLTNAEPSGFSRIRTYYEQGTNARHAVNATAARQDFCVVDGQAVYEGSEIVAARYESTHAGGGGYSFTAFVIGSNSTMYSKTRRLSGQYCPINGTYEHSSNGVGFSDPSTYNTSLGSSTEYKTNVYNRAVPNGQVFRRAVSGGSWTNGTLLTNLTNTTYAPSIIRGEFFSTWGRVLITGEFMFNVSHDVSTMQAISALM